ncbi:hypothetical protein E2P64_07595 [Candidatus Bathyarchaeota archaeon]|nr:hypothetical protein E2P64_07595 [Candidatus Bathyarchaeota archaeon]
MQLKDKILRRVLRMKANLACKLVLTKKERYRLACLDWWVQILMGRPFYKIKYPAIGWTKGKEL